ncbi:MAG: CPBP family intramembrane metalloprotease [Lachnospiraceae bacterium]|nr:CPBP family intramembrane metalloprotease [Lachnospiraceae bacterium]MBQ9234774.1 CPBP family intramembrane metalloprotease [Lachnospiraceae bacterium]
MIITDRIGKKYALRENRLKDSPDDYRIIRIANQSFLFCIIFELVGIMTIMFFGTVGAEMAIYFMTFLFSLFLYLKHKNDFIVPLKKINGKTLLHTALITVCGVPIAMLLNMFAGLLSNAGADTAEDINIYPLFVAIAAFAIVPAVVEEFVFRGVILGAYNKVDMRAGIIISSLFFALLHFSLGSVMYGFFFGLLFAAIRLATDNMLYTVIMHCLFNTINILLSYMNIGTVQVLIALTVIIMALIGFIILVISFFKDNPIDIRKNHSEDKYKPYRMITKEGYISIGICLTIMFFLLML